MRNGYQRHGLGRKLAPSREVQYLVSVVLPWVMLGIVLGLATLALCRLLMAGG